MKLIALDVGTKRIGVAKADSKVRIAIPYSAVEVNGEEFKKIASLARAWDINNFVLGLPRNSQGEETKQSLYVRKFAKELKRQIPDAKICFQDESLTSVEAEKRLKNRKKGYKKGDVDSEAAAIILQDFLEEKTGKSTSRAASAKRKSVKGAKPHRILSIVIALLVLLVVAGGVAFVYYQYSLRAVADGVACGDKNASSTTTECDSVEFTVDAGSSVSAIAASLKSAHLIRNDFVFQLYFRLNAGNESMKAGDYEFNQSMSVAEIVELLLHGGDGVYSYTVFPGDTVLDVKKDLIDLGYDEKAVVAALQKDYRNESFGWIFNGAPDNLSEYGGYLVEGYLYPDTYEFYKDDPAETVIKRLLTEAATVFKEEKYEEKFSAHGLNLYQGVTLASIIQREANNAEDMAKVAQIFYNRLAEGISLGSDVTAKYAADLLDPERQTYTDNSAVLGIDSPYNTRNGHTVGLPLGPVSNPGPDALHAVATPDNSVADKLYFLTGDDGLMYYSSTEDEHLQNIDLHCQILCKVDL